MTKLPPEKQAIIDGFAASVAEKRHRLEMLGLMNVCGLDEEKRMRLSMEFSQARADLWNAERDLESAIRSQSQ